MLSLLVNYWYVAYFAIGIVSGVVYVLHIRHDCHAATLAGACIVYLIAWPALCAAMAIHAAAKCVINYRFGNHEYRLRQWEREQRQRHQGKHHD